MHVPSVVSKKSPALHTAQARSEVLAAAHVVPVGHAAQSARDAAPGVVLNVPAGQFAHAVSAALKYCPTGHGRHVPPDVDTVLPVHVVQSPATADPGSEEVCAAHAAHAVGSPAS